MTMSDPAPSIGVASTAAAAARPSLVARSARIPAVWLTAVIALSVLVRAAISLRVPAPWILPDEIVYSELAKSIAAGDRPSIRGMPVFGWGEVYPTLIAPAWTFIDDPFTAYHAALLISALVISLTAVPAYLLARLFVPARLSFLVAVLTVTVPSMAYSGMVMTENAAYPVFVLTLLLITRCVRHPSLTNQAFALAGLGLLALTRIQGAALAGAFAAALVCYPLLGPAGERGAYLRRVSPTLGLLLLAPLAPVLASLARGEGAFGWAGSRSATFERFHPEETPIWLTLLASDLVLYVAVVPVAATVISVARGLTRQGDAAERLFAVVAVPTFAAMLVSVALVSAALDVDETENLNERYVFYVVPLLFVGFALWIHNGLPRPKAWAWATVLACCALTAVLPVDRLEYNASFQSIALMPWIFLQLTGAALHVVVGLFTLACGLLWLTCRREGVGRLVLLVVAVMVLSGTLAVASYRVSASNSSHPFRGQAANWVDAAVPRGEVVPVIWGERPTPMATPRQLYFWVMVTEFFNKRVGAVYRFGPETYHEGFLPTVPVEPGPGGTLLDGTSRVDARYALVACQTRVEGQVIARSPGGFLEVVKVDPPLRLAPRTSCVRPNW
jgi:hypothetical protein